MSKKLKKLLKYGLTYMTIPVVCLSFSNTASAVLLKGEANYFYHVYTGTVAPIFLDLGNGLVSSGNITYSLNLTNPNAQTFSFNLDTKTIQVNLDYFLDFPLLKQLGQPPLKVSLTEVGSILTEVPNLPVGKAQNLSFDAKIIGLGIADTESIFAGLKYEVLDILTLNTLVDVNAQGEFTPTANVDGQLDPIDIVSKITLPNGIEQTTNGTGYSIINPSAAAVPEPSFLWDNLLIIGVLWLKTFRLKR